MNDFLDGNHKDKNVSFGMSSQLLLSLANSFENTPKYQLLSTDVGIAGGRAIAQEIIMKELRFCSEI